MDFKPTIFVVDINGQEFKFAAMTMREIEQVSEAGKQHEGDPAALKRLNVETIVKSMKRAGQEVTVDEVMENMPGPVFRSLLAAFLGAQGVKLEAKSKGEVSLS